MKLNYFLLTLLLAIIIFISTTIYLYSIAVENDQPKLIRRNALKPDEIIEILKKLKEKDNFLKQ